METILPPDKSHAYSFSWNRKVALVLHKSKFISQIFHFFNCIPLGSGQAIGISESNEITQSSSRMPPSLGLFFIPEHIKLKTPRSWGLPLHKTLEPYTWEQDYWLDCSLFLWTLLFLHQVASVSSLPLLFSTQLCESLCVPDGGEHTIWLLVGSVSLLFILPFYPPGHLCLLPPSSLLCITPWTSLSGPDCGAHIRKWLLASLLSPLLIPPHLIRVTSNSLLPLFFSM